MKEFVIDSLIEMDESAGEILKEIKPFKVIAFYGDMGAGKTTLIKSICNKLKVIETVTSPTFSLINEYTTQLGEVIYHFDFYRINNISEIFDFGYEEYFYSNNLCFIEWPEKITDYLPVNTLNIEIKVLPDSKRIVQLNK